MNDSLPATLGRRTLQAHPTASALQVWSTLWQPLLPPHWLRAVLAAGGLGWVGWADGMRGLHAARPSAAPWLHIPPSSLPLLCVLWPSSSPRCLSLPPAEASQVAGLDPAFLSALQFVEHAESAELAQQLHAAANNPRAWADAQAMLQRLLPHSGDAQAGSQLAGMLEFNTAGREATIRLLLMGAMVGGIDAKSAPLRLKPTAAGAAGAAGLDAAARADLEWLRAQQALYAEKAELPAGLLLVGRQASGSSSGDDAAAVAGKTTGGGRGGNATSVTTVHLSWQQQQRMAPLYRLLHKHCTELERMRSAGGWVGCLGGWCGRRCCAAR